MPEQITGALRVLIKSMYRECYIIKSRDYEKVTSVVTHVVEKWISTDQTNLLLSYLTKHCRGRITPSTSPVFLSVHFLY